VGGVGLAQGYHNRPELTAEKFIVWSARRLIVPASDHPAAGPRDDETTRLYKTGDRVKWRADGQLVYLGRADQQVKVRGFRIELGEVEAALRRHPQVRDAAVAVQGPGELRLVAYLVGAGVGVEALRAWLRQTLPEYMLPGAYVWLAALPVTPSGKVDRKRLPEPAGARPDLARAYVAPRSATEQVLAELVGELLGLAQVGVEDSFFDLGGHSLLATQFISRVRAHFAVELPLRAIFEGPTVAALAAHIDCLRPEGPTEADRIAGLLKEIGDLSDEEAKQLLNE
jgi:hypothetical protein